MTQKTLTLINDVQQLDWLHEQVEILGEEWELSPKLAMQLNLVLEEVVSNIIFYGFPDKDRHDIIIRLELLNDIITIITEDDGILFNPLTVQAPDLDLPVEQREIGGLGIHFVQTIMDEVIYERKNNKNLLILRKNTKS